MKEANILKAAIVQQVHYLSADAMYRINALKANRGLDVKYLSIILQEDGSVIALIQFSYNGKELFDRQGLLDVLSNG